MKKSHFIAYLPETVLLLVPPSKKTDGRSPENYYLLPNPLPYSYVFTTQIISLTSFNGLSRPNT